MSVEVLSIYGCQRMTDEGIDAWHTEVNDSRIAGGASVRGFEAAAGLSNFEFWQNSGLRSGRLQRVANRGESGVGRLGHCANSYLQDF